MNAQEHSGDDRGAVASVRGMQTVARLRRWAAARETRNTPGGHGETGTILLRRAADEIEELRIVANAARDVLADYSPGSDSFDALRAALRALDTGDPVASEKDSL